MIQWTKKKSTNRVFGLLGLLCCLGLLACEGRPNKRHVEWVARDAWDSDCAEQAIIEKFKTANPKWKVKGEVWQVDVEATFKLVNECTSKSALSDPKKLADGLKELAKGETKKITGHTYKQFESLDFAKKPLEMSRCKVNGEDGWSLPGQEGERCWVGPKLVPDELKPQQVKK
jgi:hypothetical protein